ncbi:MAG TPA: isoprenylcysteine carboxylmethyltransferase family protein [Gemmatimonadales bacterium]|nr:isoprenylcysteine carboxylmethyltransferase family protein [Gemmatimonadales bacterium]
MPDRSPDSPGVLVWPPVLYGGAFLLGVVLGKLLPLGRLPPAPARIVGAMCVVAGLAIAYWGEQVMHRAGTNVRPDRPSTALVMDGPFRYTRNPLYVGLTLLYAGVGLLIPSTWPLLLLVPVLLVMRWGVIAREERYLEGKFGEPYRVYVRRVRRWL